VGKAGTLIPLSTFTSDGSDDDATFNSSVITSDYDEYLFIWNSIHGESDGQNWMFNGSVDNGSNYNVTKSTSFFTAEHNEDGSATSVYYSTSQDLAQGTGYVDLNHDGVGSDNDQCTSGYMTLYNPSSTTFVKHFITRTQCSTSGNSTADSFVGGYLNTTSAVNNIQFKFSSGEIQGGTVQLFGVH
jgi:hypothetical protein